MLVKGIKKNDDDFYQERLKFFYENGNKLKDICPECVDKYNDHSLLKLISIAYWVGIFNPIAHRQLRERYGYKIAYVDSMAGSGVTTTKRSNDYLCGSCPCAVLSAKNYHFPFDKIIAVEIDKSKAESLEKRLINIGSESEITVFKDDILNVSEEIAKKLQNRTISLIVIDPQAFKGMTWKAIEPLLNCKGDVMITWFEQELWRLKCAAESKKIYNAVKGNIERLTELLGNEDWRKCTKPEELTELFIKRVLSECNKEASAKIVINRSEGGYYLMILITGKFKQADKTANEWKNNVEKRINSTYGKEISSLLDVKAGRISTLKEWYKN
jgi:three-Cys-motif partner protein